MPLKKIWILCCLVLCLTACGEKSQPTQKALDFRTGLMEAGGCSFTAVVTADYGDKVYPFTLDCSYTGDSARLQVLEPESIAGIAATVTEDSTFPSSAEIVCASFVGVADFVCGTIDTVPLPLW